MMNNQAQLFPCPYHAHCDVYGCRNRAEWFVGRPDAPINCTYKLCQSCAESVVSLVPKELKSEKSRLLEQPVIIIPEDEILKSTQTELGKKKQTRNPVQKKTAPKKTGRPRKAK